MHKKFKTCTDLHANRRMPQRIRAVPGKTTISIRMVDAGFHGCCYKRLNSRLISIRFQILCFAIALDLKQE
jgi:hypothetical protein